MNKYQKVINHSATVMENITEYILMHEYSLYYTLDCDGKILFKTCRIELRKLIKDKNFVLEDIDDVRGKYYQEITIPICNEIAKKYNKKSKLITWLEKIE